MAAATQNDAASSDVRFDAAQSQFAPDLLNPITKGKSVNDQTTTNLTMGTYRLGKFMRQVSGMNLEDLQEVQQPNGNVVWAATAAIDNQNYNFTLNQGEILSSVKLTAVTSDREIQAKATQYKIDKQQTYIVIDGTKYFVTMSVPMHFGTGESKDTLLNLGIFILGDSATAAAIAGAIANLGMDAFKSAFKNIGTAMLKTVWALLRGVMRAGFNFVTRLIGRLLAGDSLAVAARAGAVAAGEGWTAAMEGLTAATLTYTVIGVVVIAAITIIIDCVLHRSYQNVYFYNLTEYDIDIDFPYKDEGDYHNLPTQSIQARVNRPGPGGIDLGSWYNGVAFSYQSGSEFAGLGYTMRFKLKDPATQNVVKTFSCMFDVPFSGDNSLFASTSEAPNYSAYYSSHEGENKTTQLSANDGAQEIVVTYDYLSGTHPDPDTGDNQYLYNSLVVIRDYAS